MDPDSQPSHGASEQVLQTVKNLVMPLLIQNRGDSRLEDYFTFYVIILNNAGCQSVAGTAQIT